MGGKRAALHVAEAKNEAALLRGRTAKTKTSEVEDVWWMREDMSWAMLLSIGPNLRLIHRGAGQI